MKACLHLNVRIQNLPKRCIHRYNTYTHTHKHENPTSVSTHTHIHTYILLSTKKHSLTQNRTYHILESNKQCLHAYTREGVCVRIHKFIHESRLQETALIAHTHAYMHTYILLCRCSGTKYALTQNRTYDILESHINTIISVPTPTSPILPPISRHAKIDDKVLHT
jgi:hypothetical protein